jgi:hypothetical protein
MYSGNASDKGDTCWHHRHKRLESYTELKTVMLPLTDEMM